MTTAGKPDRAWLVKTLGERFRSSLAVGVAPEDIALAVVLTFVEMCDAAEQAMKERCAQAALAEKRTIGPNLDPEDTVDETCLRIAARIRELE